MATLSSSALEGEIVLDSSVGIDVLFINAHLADSFARLRFAPPSVNAHLYQTALCAYQADSFARLRFAPPSVYAHLQTPLCAYRTRFLRPYSGLRPAALGLGSPRRPSGLRYFIVNFHLGETTSVDSSSTGETGPNCKKRSRS